MSYSELEEHLGEYLQDGIDLGCIVKYNPSSNLDESDWMFTHLSLQEFFLAYHLANTGDDKEITVIISFLCGLNPGCANKILQTCVKSMTHEQECESLLSYLKDLIPYYRSIS